ncbi:hypothetical protein Goarm_022266 [Gossypium armourianum]|uniref:Uncharacterized protein n=1 Tax=Gossypium armourianum TaxID=34283 RepID=A0A7J9KEI0_9ROSI|nr:hypothetical protein [Gossypium armourianum]
MCLDTRTTEMCKCTQSHQVIK